MLRAEAVKRLVACASFHLAVPVCLAQAIDPGAENDLQRVTVTGSRIQVDSGSEIGPLVVLGREELNRSGNDSLGTVLQTLPSSTGAPLNTNVNNAGDGSTRIGLRGLGPQRTLVLLNGRRLPNSGVGADSSVDLNSLPLSMVERVEVLTMGRSAVYGAEAIGGVVNVITRSGFSGTEAGAQFSRSAERDGTIARVQGLLGTALGDGHWTLGADYVHQQGVSMAARGYSANPMTFASAEGDLIPTGSPAIGDGRFIVGPGNTLGLAPGRYTRVAGVTGQSASSWRLVTPEDVFNYAPYNFLQTPNERGSLWLLGTQPLHGAEVFVEGLFSRRESSQRLAPAPYMLPVNAAPELPDGTRHIPSSNYYNPFGTNIFVGTRRLVELDERGFGERVNLWRGLVGARGRIADWEWELSVAAAESDAITRESGVPVNERFVTGLGPSGPDASGRIVCGSRDPGSGVVPQSAVIAGCVPINLFGGAGTLTSEQIDYLSTALRDDGSNSQRLANFGVTGAWGQLPAGRIQWALGTEFRRESGAYRDDPQRRSGGVGDGLAADIPGGSFESREAYAELRAPLTRDTSAIGQLDASFGGRLSDYDVFDTHTTWHAGLRWAPAESWSLHADYSSVFRAPALDELFQSQVLTASVSPRDPCGNSPTPAQSAHCAANGVPGGSYAQIEDDVSLLYQGGNTHLGPEQGYSFDTGVTLHSPNDTRWRASVDYFHTRLNDFVELGDPAVVLDECANSGTPLACSKLERFADGTLRQIDIRRNNLGRVVVDGVDFAGSLQVPVSTGQVSLQALVSNLRKFDTQVFAGGETLSRVGRGNFGLILPEWRALGSVIWAGKRLSARYTIQWIGPYTDCSTTYDDSVYCDHASSVHYHDIQASYRWPALQFEAGVSNLTDRNPPYLNSLGNTNPATYRLLGRLYFVRLSYAPRS